MKASSRVRAGIALVAAAGAAETVGRALAGVAAEPLWWHDLFTQRKEEQLRALRRQGGVDVVFSGSSKMLYGVDPTLVQSLTGARAYNASIYRGVPRVNEAWLRFVMPMVTPGVLVVGISPTEVSDNSPLTTRLAEYRAARVFRMSSTDHLVRNAGRVSYAVRYAPLLRRPRTLARHLLAAARAAGEFQWSHEPVIPGYLDRDGKGIELQDRTYRNTDRMRALIHQQAGENYVNGGEQSGAYVGMARLAQKHGCRLVGAAMPASREFIDDVFQGGRAAWDAEWVRLRELTAGIGMPLVEVAEEFQDPVHYADLIHMNGAGRAAFTERLATSLAELPGGLVRRTDAMDRGRARHG